MGKCPLAVAQGQFTHRDRYYALAARITYAVLYYEHLQRPFLNDVTR